MNAFADETPEPAKPQPLAFVQIATGPVSPRVGNGDEGHELYGLTAMGQVFRYEPFFGADGHREGYAWVRLPMTEAK